LGVYFGSKAESICLAPDKIGEIGPIRQPTKDGKLPIIVLIDDLSSDFNSLVGNGMQDFKAPCLM
jgi:hypothetical protein